MMQKILFYFMLLLFSANANAFGLRTTVVIDTTVKQLSIAQKDTLYLLDSSQYAAKQTKLRKRNQIIKVVASMVTGALAAYEKSQKNDYLMLLLGLLSISSFIAFVRAKEVKLFNSNPKEKVKKIKKISGNGFNNAWNFSLIFGIIGTISLSFAWIYLLPILATIAFMCLLGSIISYILGFEGKYDTLEEKKEEQTKGIVGILLPFIPFLYFLFRITKIYNSI